VRHRGVAELCRYAVRSTHVPHPGEPCLNDGMMDKTSALLDPHDSGIAKAVYCRGWALSYTTSVGAARVTEGIGYS